MRHLHISRGHRLLAATLAVVGAAGGVALSALPAMGSGNDSGPPIPVPGGPPIVTPGSIVKACSAPDGSVNVVWVELRPDDVPVAASPGPVIPANVPC